MPVLAFDFNLVIDDKVKTLPSIALTDINVMVKNLFYVEGLRTLFYSITFCTKVHFLVPVIMQKLGFGDVYKIDDELIYTAKIFKRKRFL